MASSSVNAGVLATLSFWSQQPRPRHSSCVAAGRTQAVAAREQEWGWGPGPGLPAPPAHRQGCCCSPCPTPDAGRSLQPPLLRLLLSGALTRHWQSVRVRTQGCRQWQGSQTPPAK
jgi:hypothetical protein